MSFENRWKAVCNEHNVTAEYLAQSLDTESKPALFIERIFDEVYYKCNIEPLFERVLREAIKPYQDPTEDEINALPMLQRKIVANADEIQLIQAYQHKNKCKMSRNIFLRQYGDLKKSVEKECKNFAKNNFVGKRYKNNNSGIKITVVIRGIDDTLIQARNAETIISLKYIKSIIQESQYMGWTGNLY
jgi:hypothetical protein